MKEYVFGNNALSDMLIHYLTEQGHEIVGKTLNKEFVDGAIKDNNTLLPLLSIEDEVSKYGEQNIGVYVTVAYKNMNKERQRIIGFLKRNGIAVLSYIHPTACVAENAIMGEGNIVLENSVIQPFVKMGDGNIIWNNVSICHHGIMGSYNYFAPGATITGRVKIGDCVFVGANSTVKNDITIGDCVLIGAGAYVNQSLDDNLAFLPPQGAVIENKISFYFQLKQ